ncbi:MAG: hypothetical protein A2Z21_05290 [Candidatus Fraserbacteria bacterium RBG_16_55_9]|uniref:Guanylate cyclase domain-containing protein n=1 Tax=Fraserbacteria sp. (strain RBG_16_55_9) TaxID=1817864 RepID=A0A1F5UR47_FRAXR|nr:MAG: hypothetical protein A2Z21_05290 [Candidatus Fraserbacteria bacterium RBG_16_55_9]
MGNEHRHLAAIMFTDMVGYTALTQQNEALALELLVEQQRMVRRLFPAHNGKEIKATGDGFFIEFSSALEAARCAIAIQKMLADRNAFAPLDRRFHIRIGLHLGDVVHRDGDVFGDGVNIASRIEPLADPGGISISEDIYRQIRNKIDAPIVSLGERELKNVELPVGIYKVVLHSEGEVPQSPTLPDKSRIAVLPLVNLSTDPQDEYFTDGMTEELIYTLSKICCLRVIAQTSVMRYKDARKSVAEIGRELKVGTVLEGSVRKAGNKLRITVQLIDVRSEEHLWSEKYDRELEDVFAIQSDIAHRVAEALQVELLAKEKSQIDKKATENLEAYQLYLKGRYFWNKWTAGGMKKGIEFFTQAITTDPNYALAYAGLADSHSGLGSSEALGLPPKEALQRAKKAAEKALELDETLAEAHTSLGLIQLHYEWNWANAKSELMRAIELNANHADAYHWYSHYWILLGQTNESLVASKRALELDPLDVEMIVHLAFHHFFARQYDLALEQCQKALEMDPSFFEAHLFLGWAYEQKAMYEEALAALQAARRIEDSPRTLVWMGRTYAMSGRRDEAMRMLNELDELSRRRYVSPYDMATILMSLGEKDQAFEWLDKAYEARTSWLVYLKVDPRFDSLRSDPRFMALLKKMGLY